jgi:hypothetical protein
VLDQAFVPIEKPATNLVWWYAARLAVAVADGSNEEALERADEWERRFGDLVVNPAWIPYRSLRAEPPHALGRTDEAVASAEAELEAARRWGAPRTVGRALRVLGSVRGTAGMAELEEAVAVLAGSIANLELAKALAALGTAVRHDRRPSEAREPLPRAFELAALCDARPLAERARQELYATGARPRGPRLSAAPRRSRRASVE